MGAPRVEFPYGSGGGGGGGVSGSGTSGTIPIWNGATSLTNSPLSFSGSTLASSSAMTGINFSAAAGGQTWTLPNNGFALTIQGTSGNGTLKLDTNNRYVGIDSPSTPADKLHIAESGPVNFRMQNVTAVTYWQHKVDASGNWGLAVNGGANAVTALAASGNVGIAVASPSSRLHIAGPRLSDYNAGVIVEATIPGINLRTPSTGSCSLYTGWFAADATSLLVATGASSIMGEAIRVSHAAGYNFAFNSGYGSVATAYGTRAWVYFNGTGTPAIQASGNVSSISDNGVGDYTVNFTSAMPNANYCISTTVGHPTGSPSGPMVAPVNTARGVPTTALFHMYTLSAAFAATDANYIYASVIR